MKRINFFLIGGAVRDKILNFEVDEKDWLITELNIKNINKRRFKAIGKNFIIFLNPINKEENALPRKRNKFLNKYLESKFIFSFELEEDLLCRDITINTLILNESGKLIDPLKNKKYIYKKELLSSSFYFMNDKIRIFRVIRFFIKYYFNGFYIFPCTIILILEIIFEKKNEEYKIERIFKEIYKVSKYNKLYFIFYNMLYKFNMLNIFFKDLNTIYIISDILKFNKYVCFSEHINKILYFLFDKTNNNMLNFSILFLKIGYINSFNKKKHNISYKPIDKKKIEEYKKNFILSKKYCIFLYMISSFYFFYIKKRLKNKKFLNFFIKNICFQKNKIRIINIILILSVEEEKNSIINNFYLKYFLLDIIHEINKNNLYDKNIEFIYKKNRNINNLLKNRKMYRFYTISK